MIGQAVEHSVIGRARKNGLITVDTINIRDYSTNKHSRVDDYPYGGGAGMVIEAEPVYRAIQESRRRTSASARVVYLTPQAEVLTQTKVEELAKEDSLILLCGHYEGIDDRVLQKCVTDYISIGDYVLTGGELGALILIDAVSRFVPGVLGNDESADFESLQDSLLEYPHYTRPEIWHETKVPEVLLSGDHKKIEDWRHEQSLIRTQERRPDLLAKSRRVRTIWYGNEQSETSAQKLTDALTRYGTIYNYNRKTLQKKQLALTAEDLLVLIDGTDGTEAITFSERFRNLKGNQTPCILVRLTEGGNPAPQGGGETIRALASHGIYCMETARLPENCEDTDASLQRLALSIRTKIERGALSETNASIYLRN